MSKPSALSTRATIRSAGPLPASQRDPKNEYKKAGYDLFVNLMAKISSTVLSKFFAARVHQQPELEQTSAAALQDHSNTSDRAANTDALLAQLQAIQTTGDAAAPEEQEKPATRAITREAPCPCSSGRAFAECHGKLDDDLTDVYRDKFDDSSGPASLVAE